MNYRKLPIQLYLWGLYLALVTVSGIGFTAYWMTRISWELSLITEMGIWFALLVTAGSFQVPVAPKVKADLSAAGLFAAALIFPPASAALVGGAAVVTYTYLARFWGDRYRYPWYKFSFNGGATALYTGLASWVFVAQDPSGLVVAAVIPVAAEVSSIGV